MAPVRRGDDHKNNCVELHSKCVHGRGLLVLRGSILFAICAMGCAMTSRAVISVAMSVLASLG